MSKLLAFAVAASAVLSGAPALASTPGPYDLTVQVVASTRATERLEAAGEHFDIEVLYYGYPNDDGEYLADDAGMVELARVNVILPAAGGKALIVGDHLDLARLRYLNNRGVQVSVDVFGSGPADRASPVSCDALDDALRIARQEPVRLNCRVEGDP